MSVIKSGTSDAPALRLRRSGSRLRERAALLQSDKVGRAAVKMFASLSREKCTASTSVFSWFERRPLENSVCSGHRHKTPG